MRRWILSLILLWSAANGAWAQTIVGLGYVRQAVARGALLWDVRDKGAYAKGHVPGAVNIGDPMFTLRDPFTEELLPAADVGKVLGAAGLDPAREIIVYGVRGLPQSYYAQTVLQHFGAADARVFHDGVDAWRGAGLALDKKTVRRAPVALRLTPQPGVLASTKEVVAALRRGDAQILDVRSVKEFTGEDLRAIRGGHIPGAVNVPFEENWVDPGTIGKLSTGATKDSSGMALKPRDQLAKLYAGLDPAKEIFVYCQSGGRAALSAVVLAELGFRKVRLYEPSWLGYASWLSAPVDDEVWANFGALSNAIRELDRRMREHERRAGRSAR
jgi:thiosulfate/3-mercaptopyruvate sulfurtransferase